MNRRLLFFACVCLATAARAEPKDDAPEPPFVAPMPNPGHWIRSIASGESGDKKLVKPIEVSTETWLVGKNRFDLTTLSDGARTEQFLVDGVAYQSAGAGGGMYIEDPRLDGSVQLPSVKDWSELTWVAPEFYKGQGNAENFKCFIYEKQSPQGVQRAMIETTTKLPITIESGHKKYVYRYLTATSQLPKNEVLDSSVDGYRKKLQGMSVNRKPR